MSKAWKLSPPQGWRTVAWELAVVTLGVLLALAAQQWVESRTVRAKVEASKAALRDELAEHYGYAVEFRTVFPCLQAQLHRIRDRVLASGQVLESIPIYNEGDNSYVVRIPSKEFPTAAWEAAVNDGIIQRYEPSLRRQLAGHYTQLETVRDATWANTESEQGLAALAHPLPLDPVVRFSIVTDIEKLSGRLENMDILHGQIIDYIEKVGMLPGPEAAQAITERYGTYKFCKAHGLPMRSFKDAMQAEPN